MLLKRIDIGYTIRKIRELKSITREEIAAEMNMSLSGYSKMERGETEVTLGKLDKIAQLLGLDIIQLLQYNISGIFSPTGNVAGAGSSVKKKTIELNDYREKYIRMLEAENERLKSIISKNKPRR